MPNQDEPLPAAPDEIEEISTEFIVTDEPAAPAADPFAPRRGAPVAPAAPVVAPATATGSRRQGFPLLVALVFLAIGGGAGFFAGVLWERQGGALPKGPATPAATPPAPAPPTSADADEPSPPPPKPTKGAKPARKAPSAAAKVPPTAREPAPRGQVRLTAPAEAEVYLDGRRIGRGSMQVDVAAGAHRIEVRLGKAKVAERFEVEPNETWTYDVTPAK